MMNVKIAISMYVSIFIVFMCEYTNICINACIDKSVGVYVYFSDHNDY